MEKSLLHHTLDEPRFRKCARRAYMEGLIDALATIKKEKEGNL